jgi:hypothetical protein
MHRLSLRLRYILIPHPIPNIVYRIPIYRRPYTSVLLRIFVVFHPISLIILIQSCLTTSILFITHSILSYRLCLISFRSYILHFHIMVLYFRPGYPHYYYYYYYERRFLHHAISVTQQKVISDVSPFLLQKVIAKWSHRNKDKHCSISHKAPTQCLPVRKLTNSNNVFLSLLF